MMENIERYLNALTTCRITGATPKELRLNDQRRVEYDKEMTEMFKAFRDELLMGAYSVQDFIVITRRVEEAKKQRDRFRRIVEKTDSAAEVFHPLYALFGVYKRQVEQTVELVESVNIMKLAQAASSTPKEKTPEVQQVISPISPEETAPTPTIAPAPEKVERRNLNDKNTPHPGEYVGLKEMEAGEHISHTTAVKMHKDPYYKPAFRDIGRSVRVDIEVLHELERKKAIEKDKPIGNNPRRGKK